MKTILAVLALSGACFAQCTGAVDPYTKAVYAGNCVGANGAAKIQAAIGTLPAGGGVVDSSGILAAMAMADLGGVSKPTTVILGGQWTVASSMGTSAKVKLVFNGSACLTIAAGQTFTVNGGLENTGHRPLVCPGSQGRLLIPSPQVTETTMQEWGAVGDCVADDAPAWRAMLGSGVRVLRVTKPTSCYLMKSYDPTPALSDNWVAYGASNQRIVFEEGATIKIDDGLFIDARATQPNKGSFTHWNNKQNVVIEGKGTINLNGTNNKVPAGCALGVGYCPQFGFNFYNGWQNVRIADVALENSAGQNPVAMNFTAGAPGTGASRGMFENLKIHNCGTAIPGNTNQWDCSGLYIEGTETVARNNHIYNDADPFAPSGGIEIHGSNFAVTGNKIEEMYPCAYLTEPAAGVSLLNGDVSGNQCLNSLIGFVPFAIPVTTAISAPGCTWAGGTATCTSSGHHVPVAGTTGFVYGVNPAGYNSGVSPVALTYVNAAQFSYAVAVDPGPYVSGGTAFPVLNGGWDQIKIHDNAVTLKQFTTPFFAGVRPHFVQANRPDLGNYTDASLLGPGFVIGPNNTITDNDPPGVATSIGLSVAGVNGATVAGNKFYNLGGPAIIVIGHRFGTNNLHIGPDNFAYNWSNTDPFSKYLMAVDLTCPTPGDCSAVTPPMTGGVGPGYSTTGIKIEDNKGARDDSGTAGSYYLLHSALEAWTSPALIIPARNELLNATGTPDQGPTPVQVFGAYAQDLMPKSYLGGAADMAATGRYSIGGDATAYLDLFSAGVMRSGPILFGRGCGVDTSTSFITPTLSGGTGCGATVSGLLAWGDDPATGYELRLGSKLTSTAHWSLFNDGGYFQQSTNAARVPLKLQLPAGQAVNSFQIDSSAPAALFAIDQNGKIVTGAADAALFTSGTLGLARGGTNQTTWTASRCVRVNNAGTALDVFGKDCFDPAVPGAIGGTTPGAGTFTSPLTIGTAAIAVGAGAPAGACATGDLYLNTTGGAGTTLWVCEAGGWVGK